jgi:hypothetical protein
MKLFTGKADPGTVPFLNFSGSDLSLKPLPGERKFFTLSIFRTIQSTLLCNPVGRIEIIVPQDRTFGRVFLPDGE